MAKNTPTPDTRLGSIKAAIWENDTQNGTRPTHGSASRPASWNPPSDMTSLVSYPQRCSDWGDAKFRGNCDGRLFRDLLLRYRPQRVADPMMGSGTTRDVVTDLNQRAGMEVDYTGSDLRDGFDLLRHNLPGTYDLVWVHPPYWNIIRYSDHPDDLSTVEDYEEFLTRLQRCLARCHHALNPGGRLAVLVGDVRRRGAYYPLGRDVMNMAGGLGTLVSVIIKAQHNCRSDTKAYGFMAEVPIKHEYCIIFQKR